MTRVSGGIGIAIGLATLGALSPVAASAQKAEGNALEIVVGSGPFAGTYKAPTDQVICLYVKKQPQFSVSYKDFSPSGPKALAEAGLVVNNPDEAGAKRGHVLVTFGSADKKPTFYDVTIPGPGAGPITMSRSGTRGEMAYEGKTKDGVQVRITAKCSDVDVM